jgi:ABC-type transporter Mla subunit MlaD
VSTKQDGSAEIQALLYELEEGLYDLIKREHYEIRDELTQMGSVVNDAIKTLVKSLNSLSVQLKEQNELVENIAATDDGAGTEMQQDYRALSRMIDQNISAVVRSLQFEDIVQQLVSHCRTRSDGLEQLFERLNQDVSKLKNTSHDESGQILSAMQVDVAKVRKQLEKENPVKQTSMGAGGIELF